MTAGQQGPILLEDAYLLEKIAKFNRERIPERVVHAKGTGAYGYFEVTDDVSQYTKAKFLNKVGKKTKIFARLSTTGGERGSPDAVRDIRGFSMKFYTEDGNYDLTTLTVEAFPTRDPIKLPDQAHALKKNPVTGMYDPNDAFEFFSSMP